MNSQTIKKIMKQAFKKANLNSEKINASISYPSDFDKSSIEIIERVSDYTMTSIERIFSLIEAVRYIVNNDIEGDFVECGVWKGGSSMAMAYTLQSLFDSSRNIHLFDTFSGMSSPSDKDVDYCGVDAASILSKSNIKNQSSVWCYASIEEVKANMNRTEYDLNKINFIQGKVEDTIPKFSPEKIALLRLDTDWYESTYHELKHLFPRLVKGGVIIIDDYGHWQGCREATDNYIKENKIKIILNRIDMTGRIGIKQ